MNYFERLLRRALLRPAKMPGAALDDPFSAVADWPLEAPAASPQPSVLPAAPPPAPMDHLAVSKTQTPGLPASTQPQPPEQSIAERSSGRQPDVPAPQALRGESPAPAAGLPLSEIPRAVPSTPRPEALQLADEFMRSLGVKSQLPELPAPSEVPVPAALAVPLAPEPRRTSPAPAPLQALAPPPPPPPPPSPPRAMPPRADPRSPARVKPVERTPEAAPRSQALVETRHVVVEHREAAAQKRNAITGSGAPHFGLGQL